MLILFYPYIRFFIINKKKLKGIKVGDKIKIIYCPRYKFEVTGEVIQIFLSKIVIKYKDYYWMELKEIIYLSREEIVKVIKSKTVEQFKKEFYDDKEGV